MTKCLFDEMCLDEMSCTPLLKLIQLASSLIVEFTFDFSLYYNLLAKGRVCYENLMTELTLCVLQSWHSRGS